jgi:hypothetical protein
MLTRTHFPSAAWRFVTKLSTVAAALAIFIGVAGVAAPARADNNLLRGPPPFLKQNELSAHFLLTGGIGDSWSGNKVGLDYGFQLGGPLSTWLDLQLNLETGTCARFSDSCAHTGNAYEVLAGGKWKLSTPTPIVPYAKAGAGLIFLFPDQARSAIGLAVRAGGGLNYFIFDWLGFGVEAGLSVGHAFFDSTYTASHTYAVLDIGVGVEVQF